MPKITPTMNKPISIPSEMFGANMLFDRDRIGDGTYDDAIKYLGANTIRYPGGAITEKYFDVQDPTKTVTLDPITGQQIHLTGIDTFLGYANANGLGVSLVLPTNGLVRTDQGGLMHVNQTKVDDIVNFVSNAISGKYGIARIESIEIGNEYWYSGQMNHMEYAEAINQLAPRIQKVLDLNWNSSMYGGTNIQPEIIVQFGSYGAYSQSPGDVQNVEIIQSLDPTAMDAIDGVSGHLYATTIEQITNSQWFFERFREWDNFRPDRSFTWHVTEWNTNHASSNLDGLKQSGAILSLFGSFVSAGVDSAFIWPVQENTGNDLFGDEGEVVSTFGGEIYSSIAKFDTRESTLNYFEIKSDSTSAWFENLTSHSLFVANNSSKDDLFSLDLSQLGGTANGYYKILSSSGSIGDPLADPVWTFGSLAGQKLDQFEVNLGPAEVLVITVPKEGFGVELEGMRFLGFQAGNGNRIPSDIHDIFGGTKWNDILKGWIGDDSLAGLKGDDLLMGGDGSDTLRGGGGADTLIGGLGPDSLFGGVGDDVIVSGDLDSDLATEIYLQVEHFLEPYSGIVPSFSGIGQWLSGSFCVAMSKDQLGSGSSFVPKSSPDIDASSDYAKGGDGDDLMIVNSLVGSVDGGTGDDVVMLLGGSSSVNGGSGDDVIIIGSQVADVHGSSGADSFIFMGSTPGVHHIADYDSSEDRIFMVSPNSLGPAGVFEVDSALVLSWLASGVATQMDDDLVVDDGINQITIDDYFL